MKLKFIFIPNLKLKKQLKQMKTLIAIGLSLYKAKGFFQGFLILSTALTISPLLDSFKKFLSPNFDYLAIWLILMTLDALSGIYKHSGIWDKNAPNTLSKDLFFFKLLRKSFSSAIWLVVINLIENYSKVAHDYLDIFGIGVLISWLSWSVASNLYVITGESFPPQWVMVRLKSGQSKNQKKLNE